MRPDHGYTRPVRAAFAVAVAVAVETAATDV
jgi:hypothetical protein